MHRAHAVGRERPRPFLALALTALVASTAAAAGCLGSKPAMAGTAAWDDAEEGIVEVGRQLYHYRTVYWPEPDRLNPSRDGFEVIFQDTRFYIMLLTCGVAQDVLSCALRVSIWLLDLLYEEEVEPPQDLPEGLGQVYLEEGGHAGFLWQGANAVRLLVEA